jgi:hypothetical protein
MMIPGPAPRQSAPRPLGPQHGRREDERDRADIAGDRTAYDRQQNNRPLENHDHHPERAGFVPWFGC